MGKGNPFFIVKLGNLLPLKIRFLDTAIFYSGRILALGFPLDIPKNKTPYHRIFKYLGLDFFPFRIKNQYNVK